MALIHIQSRQPSWQTFYFFFLWDWELACGLGRSCPRTSPPVHFGSSHVVRTETASHDLYQTDTLTNLWHSKCVREMLQRGRLTLSRKNPKVSLQRRTEWWNWKISPQKRQVMGITITIPEILHRPVFYLKHDISKTGFCLRLQVERIQVGTKDRDSLCLRAFQRQNPVSETSCFK
jgi:hypothetical protein